MSEHDTEYRDLLAKTMQRDRESILAHWKLGALFAKYGEPVAEIAMAIERSVTYVADHVTIVQVIPTREDLDAVLADRDDIQVWTVLVDWVKAGGPGQESDEEPDANDISRQKRTSRPAAAGQRPAAGRPAAHGARAHHQGAGRHGPEPQGGHEPVLAERQPEPDHEHRLRGRHGPTGVRLVRVRADPSVPGAGGGLTCQAPSGSSSASTAGWPSRWPWRGTRYAPAGTKPIRGPLPASNRQGAAVPSQ